MKWFVVKTIVSIYNTNILIDYQSQWVDLIIFDDMIMKQTLCLRLINTWKRLCKHFISISNSSNPTAPQLNKLKANGDSGTKHSFSLVSPTWKKPSSRSCRPLLLLFISVNSNIYPPLEAVYFIPVLELNYSCCIIIRSRLWNTTIPVTIPKNIWSTYPAF